MAKALRITNGVPSITTVGDALPTIYDETFASSGTTTSGTAITLPSSKTYDSAELLVLRAGQALSLTTDFAYVGSAPRTQITLTFDLVDGEKIRFIILRNV
jgi:hypothetical protein